MNVTLSELVYAVRGQHFPTIRVDSQSKSNTIELRTQKEHACGVPTQSQVTTTRFIAHSNAVVENDINRTMKKATT